MTRRFNILAITLAVIIGTLSTANAQTIGKQQTIGNKQDTLNNLEEKRRDLSAKAYILMETGAIEEAKNLFFKAAEMNSAVANYYLSMIFESEGEVDSAITFARKAIELDGTNHWYKILYAQLLLETEKISEAQEILQQLQKELPNNLDILDLLASLYDYTRQDDKIFETLDKIEQLSGQETKGVYMRTRALMRQDKPQDAAQLLEDFLANVPNPKLSTMLGDIYEMLQQPEGAFKAYQRAIQYDPTDKYARMKLTEAAGNTERYDVFFENANIIFADSIHTLNDNLEFLKNIENVRGFVATFMPQVDTLYLNLQRTYAQDTTFANAYAIYLARTDRAAKGLEILEENLQYHKDEIPAWERVVMFNYFLEDKAKALDCIKQATEHFPLAKGAKGAKGTSNKGGASKGTRDTSVIDLHINYISLLQTCDSSSLALEKAMEVQKFIPKKDKDRTLTIYGLLGDAHFALGNSSQAFKWFDKALRLKPNDIGVLNNYAYYLALKEEELDKALEMSSKTIEEEPENATYLDTYAWILHLLGRDKEAKEYMRKVMTYSKEESATEYDHYGDILYSNGDKELAHFQWVRALKLDPSREDIKEKLNR